MIFDGSFSCLVRILFHITHSPSLASKTPSMMSQLPWGPDCVIDIMMTSSNGNILCVTGHLCGEFTGPRWIPRTKASDTELRFFFCDLRSKKLLSKQSWGWLFETLLYPLWRHRNDQCSWKYEKMSISPSFSTENVSFPMLSYIICVTYEY